MKKFHITDGKRKTTVTLHNRLADYLALALAVACVAHNLRKMHRLGVAF